jgi:hypothetical protein
MFYRLLGMAVWKLATAYIRQRFRRRLRTMAVLAALTVGVAGYLATRSGD